MSFTPLKNPPSWRRIAVATWRPPNDPTVYGDLKIDFTQGKKLLDEIHQQSPEKITVTHLVAKTIALTLKKFPDLNAIIRWRKIYLRKSVDIFLQVAIEEGKGDEQADLSGVRIANCDQKALGEIASELRAKATGIRRRNDSQFLKTHNLLRFLPDFLLPIVLRLMSFMIYNLGFDWPAIGMAADPFGSAMVTSVGMFKVPPGYAPLVPVSRVGLIVCVGEIRDQPWVVEGKVTVRPILELRITFDHRLMDGITGARMAHYFKDLLENPSRHPELYA